MELTIDNPWRDLTMEVHRIKEDAVTYIDLQDWEEKMKESIYPLSTNILGRLKGLEGGPP